ncbi:ABC transporter permease [Kytococcus sedentarius]|uniref:Predicted permease n=1 Tax=Kytococcus sedentarius (strain ATCC 14392 / DSM 20547 / JCM 11482 / CCUG 33030 / NBRC 15357 / NCTC 11040 / CCM 314 / 541) TaxID=478801 RepID=C7NEV4_KYTSD|nr:FtsX-like permease family protein [Kytococcus sedentarius]ACV05778.1 Predicted permease [Kytococcus sedentarius DSM 20547]QQB64185.1 ABC transporter permease [Kytococcus sedentarius]STX12808.1 FtsX-like permease family [Kytococcus sedentarius]
MKVTGLTSFTLRLTRARFASREGESLLYLASTLAFVICSALAFTVAGGTWMFHQRWASPTSLHAELIAADPSVEAMMGAYVGLAGIACALVVPAMASLAASAAVLGARGRERRMSALRLLGLSSGDVTRMALIDTLIQATLGVLVGYVLYLLTLPAWSALELQGKTIEVSEMLLPAPLALAVGAVTIIVGVLASWWGMRQVRVSPLGVARRAGNPALRRWRPLIFLVLIGVGVVTVNTVSPRGEIGPWLLLGGALLAVLAGMNVIGPWILQVVCGLLARIPSPTVMWAARRVQADPRATWGRVAGLGLMAFIGSYVAMMPLPTEAPDTDNVAATFATTTGWDFTKGAAITLGVGLVVAATATYITQASAVFERAEQTRSLYRMGSSTGFLRRVAWLEVFGPLVLALGLGWLLGMGLALPMASDATNFGYERSSTGPVLMGGILVAGLAFTVLALTATSPLQRQVLRDQRRRAD